MGDVTGLAPSYSGMIALAPLKLRDFFPHPTSSLHPCWDQAGAGRSYGLGPESFQLAVWP